MSKGACPRTTRRSTTDRQSKRAAPRRPFQSFRRTGGLADQQTHFASQNVRSEPSESLRMPSKLITTAIRMSGGHRVCGFPKVRCLYGRRSSRGPQHLREQHALRVLEHEGARLLDEHVRGHQPDVQHLGEPCTTTLEPWSGHVSVASCRFSSRSGEQACRFRQGQSKNWCPAPGDGKPRPPGAGVRRANRSSWRRRGAQHEHSRAEALVA